MADWWGYLSLQSLIQDHLTFKVSEDQGKFIANRIVSSLHFSKRSKKRLNRSKLDTEVSLLHFIVVLTLFEVKEALKTKF